MIVIGITGPARSGKDTLADLLIAQKQGLAKASFADPLKKMLAAGLGLSQEQLYGGAVRERPHPDYGVTPRSMMQTLGTEWGRKLVHPDIWVRALEKHMRESLDHRAYHLGFVLPDVRFENEAAMVRRHGVLIHLQREDRDAVNGVEGHASEAGVNMADEDFFFRNDGSLDQLREFARGILRSEMGWRE